MLAPFVRPLGFGRDATGGAVLSKRLSPPPPVEVPSPRRALLWEAESWDDMRRFNESFGGRVMAKRVLPPDVFDSMERELETLFREHNQGTEGRVAIPNEYLLVVARKA